MNVVAEGSGGSFTVALVAEADTPERTLLHAAMKGDRIVRLPDGRPVGVVVEGIVWPYEGKLCAGACQTFKAGSVFIGVDWRDAKFAAVAREARLLVNDAGFLLTGEP